MGDWFEAYGLDRDPFSDSGVQGLFYPGGNRGELQGQIEHLMRFGNALVMIQGGIGLGKSALAMAVAAVSGDSADTVLIDAGLMDTPLQVMRRIMQGLGLEVDPGMDGESLQETLARWIQSPERHDRQVWILVDDAHHLDAEATAALCALRQRIDTGLGMALFAEAQWESVLREQLLAAQDLHVMILDAFDREDTVAYIHYRLKTAGLSDELPYSVSELEHISSTARGIPGRINRVAREVLQTEAHVADEAAASLPLWHISVVGATLVALLLLYIWGSGEDARQRDALPEPSTLVPPGAYVDETPELAAEVDPVETFESSSPIASLATENNGRERDSDSAALLAPAPAPAPEPDPAPEPGPQAVKSPYDRIDVDQVAPSTSPKVETADLPQPKASQPVAQAGLEPDEQWLLDQDRTRFTMQLLSTNDASAIAAFRARYELEVHEFRKRVNGREWRALVYGSFVGRKAAEGALAGLPERLRDAKPWIRSIASVQDEIRAAQR